MLHGHATTPNGTVPPTLDQASQNGPPAGMALVNGRQHGGNGNDNLTLGRRQTPAKTDPLVGNGRHFGRTVHAFCRIFPLIKDGMMRQIHLHSGITQAARLSEQERREQLVFDQLKSLDPNLEERIFQASTQELHYIAQTIAQGVSRARSDDVSSTKGVIIGWITPKDTILNPRLTRNRKTDRGFYHYRTGELLCPPTLDWSDEKVREQLRTGELIIPADCWPSFVYEEKYNPANPWEGLWRGDLLVKAFKHIFISPSSVEESARSTRAGNAQIHGMTAVTKPSLAYIASIVRVNLSSCESCSRSDVLLDLEGFYRSVLRFLEDPNESQEVEELLKWWNLKIFPAYHSTSEDHVASVPSVRDRIREWRAQLAVSAGSASGI